MKDDAVADSVHCHTGSLENTRFDQVHLLQVHCRTGSLEMMTVVVSR